MDVIKMLRFDLEELDAVMKAQLNKDAANANLRSKYTPTPKTRYHAQIQEAKQ